MEDRTRDLELTALGHKQSFIILTVERLVSARSGRAAASTSVVFPLRRVAKRSAPTFEQFDSAPTLKTIIRWSLE